MTGGNFRIVARPENLQEGLFGQVLLWIFEVLPYLAKHGLRPEWRIHARHYGEGGSRPVLPGVFDVAYEPSPATREVTLNALREWYCHQLGPDWPALSALWQRYFLVPERTAARADALGPLDDVLGIHYRGTDKVTSTHDSNPVGHEDFLAIIRDFLGRRPEFRRVFLATDDAAFRSFLLTRLPLDIINFGEVGFHKATEPSGHDLDKDDRALLDCLVLSRCGAVLKTSSALSGFAKILSPDLEIHRCAASKLFSDVPYFPVAYIPPYRSDDPAVAAILERLMADDWSHAGARQAPFAHRARGGSLRHRALYAYEAVFGSRI